MDDGLDDRRGDVPGAQDILLNTPVLSIFNAWADEPWVNNGAAVRVSLVCFGVDAATSFLNGQAVQSIHADLTGGDGLDLTLASVLPENTNASFEGTKKYGDFDIAGDLARQWLGLPNPHGRSNALVVKPWRNGQDLSRRPSDTWIIDFGTTMSEGDAALFEAPFGHVLQRVKPERLKAKLPKDWWLHERARTSMRRALLGLHRYIATTRVSKHRFFVFLDSSVLADTRLNVIGRADDCTFGILSSRFHEVWSLAQASVHGDGTDGGRPTYNAKSCFETFPFPAGLTPADTAHQRVEILPDGSVIPGNWCQSAISPETLPASGQAKWDSDPKFPSAVHMQNAPVAPAEQAQGATNSEANDVGLRGANPTYADSNPIEFSSAALSQKPKVGVARMSGPISKSEALRGSASEPPPPLAPKQTGPDPIDDKIRNQALRNQAIAIAQAAKRLNDLRENWLNPPEWTHKVPEVTPLGLDISPYPDRIEPKHGISEADLKALQKRTLTNLYNLKPAWLTMAHQQLDQAVAAAYGWTDYQADMPDDELLKRLLALNLARSVFSQKNVSHAPYHPTTF